MALLLPPLSAPPDTAALPIFMLGWVSRHNSRLPLATNTPAGELYSFTQPCDTIADSAIRWLPCAERMVATGS
jgi:hypothetical protein